MLVLCSGICSPRAISPHDVPRCSRSRQLVLTRASKESETRKPSRFGGLGDLLGPIGLTLGSKLTQVPAVTMLYTMAQNMCSAQRSLHLALKCLQGQKNKEDQKDSAFYRTAEQTDNGKPSSADHQSIHEMSTEEWRAAYEQEGCVDLWVEEEFNSGSRLMVSPALFSVDAFTFSCITSKPITHDVVHHIHHAPCNLHKCCNHSTNHAHHATCC